MKYKEIQEHTVLVDYRDTCTAIPSIMMRMEFSALHSLYPYKGAGFCTWIELTKLTHLSCCPIPFTTHSDTRFMQPGTKDPQIQMPTRTWISAVISREGLSAATSHACFQHHQTPTCHDLPNIAPTSKDDNSIPGFLC